MFALMFLKILRFSVESGETVPRAVSGTREMAVFTPLCWKSLCRRRLVATGPLHTTRRPPYPYQTRTIPCQSPTRPRHILTRPPLVSTRPLRDRTRPPPDHTRCSQDRAASPSPCDRAYHASLQSDRSLRTPRDTGQGCVNAG